MKNYPIAKHNPLLLLVNTISILVLGTFLVHHFATAAAPTTMPASLAMAPLPAPTSWTTPALSPLASQPTQTGFYGMNTYFTGFERIFNDGDDGILTLMNMGLSAGVEWGREEISWANLQQHGNYWDRNNRKIYDQRIREMAEAGYGIIGMIVTTPAWARVNDCKARTEYYKPYGVIAQEYWCPPQNPQDFANFVQAAVERYDGDGVDDAEGSPRIAVWQIWNEPNHWETWAGSAAEYATLLKVAYAAVKRADPTALVITAGLYVLDGQSNADGNGCTCHQDGLYFFEQALNAVPDAWLQFDALAIHPYMPYDAPDSSNIMAKVTLWGRLATSSQWLYNQTQRRGGPLRPYWISEIGWITCESGLAATSTTSMTSTISTTYHLTPTMAAWTRYAIPTQYRLDVDVDDPAATLSADALCKTELEQSNYLLRAHAIALAHGVHHLNYHQLEDKFDTHERDIWQATALLKTKQQNYAPKTAYTAYSVLTQQLTNTVYLGTGHLHTYVYDANASRNPSSRYHIRFKPAEYTRVEMLWRTNGSETVTMQVEPGATQVILVDFQGVHTPLSVQNDMVQFTVAEQPVYVRQSLSLPTPTPTMTPSPTMTPTPTLTMTPTPSATPTPTATSTPPAGDAYEPDNSCSSAPTLLANGQPALHTFHLPADSDWVQLDVVSGTTYLIETHLPSGSRANVDMQRYSACGGTMVERQESAILPTTSLRYTAKNNSKLWLRFLNHDAKVAGTDVTYELVARQLPNTLATDGVLLVLGYVGESSVASEQAQRVYMTNAMQEVQDLVHTVGYTQVYALLPDLYDTPPTLPDVEYALTTWAKTAVADGGTLTVYIIGQSNPTTTPPALWLNKSTGDMITPALLDTWFTTLENRTTPLSLTVIIDAPLAGEFVKPLTKPGRVIIASTGVGTGADAASTHTAWAVDNRLLFTHFFVTALRRGSSLAQAYTDAQRAVTAANPWQQPSWSASTGNNAALARGMYAATSTSRLAWSPVITNVVAPITATVGSPLALQATIQDDEAVAQAWAIVVPPGYTPPAATGAFMPYSELPTLMLTPTDKSSATMTYTITATDVLTTTGTYRVVVFAKDTAGLLARPTMEDVVVNPQDITLPDGVVYLPIVQRIK